MTDSRIEGGVSGTTVGAVRDVGFGDARLRQRLVAHSDVDCSFSYEGVGEFAIEGHSLAWYRGTLRLLDVDRG